MSRLKQKGRTSVVKGKNTKKQQVNIFRMSTLAVAIHLLSVPVLAGPEGGAVVGGAGKINVDDLTTTITQTTDLMAIDWQSFNVSANERVQYIQPDSSSVSLNRILSNSGSQIHGQIDANGHVILVNPNGVFFGENATVNVGGILASGLAIDPSDFMNSKFAFGALENTEGKVINSGLISAATGGSVTLLGKQVRNDGLIVANLGVVNLAAGKEAVLTFDAAGLMGVHITKEILQSELGVDAAVVNAGDITAEGGQILLSASVSEDIFSQAVRIDSEAKSVVVHEDGSFTLGAGADVVNTGSIRADASSDVQAGQVVLIGENIISSGDIHADGAGGDIEISAKGKALLTGSSSTTARSDDVGGTVKVLGNIAGVIDSSRVDVSGLQGGGEIYIGGGFQGANSNLPNALNTAVSENAKVNANAIAGGNGGTVIVWADNSTRYYGTIEALGGRSFGNGGFVEVSGKDNLDFIGLVDTSAETGSVGTLLLDPQNIIITASGPISNIVDETTLIDFDTDFYNTRNYSPSRIVELLGTNNLELQAREDITVSSPIDASATPNSFTLTAGDDIDIVGDITLGSGDLTLTAGASGCASNCIGGFTARELNIGANLITNGGDIYLYAYDRNFGVGVIRFGNTDINISTGTGGGDVHFFDPTVNADDSDVVQLNLTAGTGSISFDSSLGTNTSNNFEGLNIASASSVDLNEVWVSSGGIDITADTINLNGDLRADGNGVTGPISLNGAVHLTSSILVDAYTGSSEGDKNSVSIVGTVTSDSPFDLTIDASSITVGAISNTQDINFNARDGALLFVGDLSTAGATTLRAASIIATNITGSITSWGLMDLDTTVGDILVTGSLTNQAANIDIDVVGNASIASLSVNGTSADQNAGFVSIDANAISIGSYDASGYGEGGVDGNGGNANFNFSSVFTLTGNVDVSGAGSGSSGSIWVAASSGNTDQTINIGNDASFAGNSFNFNAGGGDDIFKIGAALGNAVYNGDNGDDTFTITGTDVDGTIYGGGNTDTLTAWSDSESSPNEITPDNIWDIDSTNGHTLENGTGSVSFSGIDSLFGGDHAEDTFNFSSSFSGDISGGSGNDTFNLGGGYSAKSLTGGDGEDSFNFSGNFSVTGIDGVIEGGSGNDNFFVASGVTATIDGGDDVDTIAAPNVDNAWSIDTLSSTLNSGFSFKAIENLTGGSADDTFTFNNNVKVDGLIDGDSSEGPQTGADKIVLDSSYTNAVTIQLGGEVDSSNVNISNLEAIQGNGSGNATLYVVSNAAVVDDPSTIDVDEAAAADIVNWRITGENDGVLLATSSVTGVDINFIDIRNLAGGEGTDDFTIAGGATLTGSIDGGGTAPNSLSVANNSGTDTYVWALTENTSTVSAYDGTLDYEKDSGADLTFTAIQSLTASGTGTQELVARNLVNTWQINSVDSTVIETGKTDGSVVFNGFTNIYGGNLTDIFNINASFTGKLFGEGGADSFKATKVGIVTTVDGGDADDTLIAAPTNAESTSTNFWSIEDFESGKLVLSEDDVLDVSESGISFSEIEIANGSETLVDVFKYSLSTTGIAVTAGEGVGDEANFSGITGTDIAISLTDVSGFEKVVGNGRSGSSLSGTNAGDSWVVSDTGVTVDGVDDGFINGTIEFINFANLIGGSGNDSFTIGSDGRVTGSIDGGDGINSLTGPNVNSTWVINGAAIDAATPQSIYDTDTAAEYVKAFTGIQSLIGGSGDDTFTVTGTTLLAGAVGGGGTDALDYSGFTGTGPIVVTLGNQNSAFNSIESYTGKHDGSDTGVLTSTIQIDTGISGSASWEISAVNDGSVSYSYDDGGTVTPSITFTNFNNLSGGENADDTFTVTTAAGCVTGLVDGQGGSDTLVAFAQENTWYIESSSGGNLNATTRTADNGTKFGNFENLTGNTEVDTFRFYTASTFGNSVDAGDGNDIVDLVNSGMSSLNVTLGSTVHGVSDTQVVIGNASSMELTVAASTAGLVSWSLSNLSGAQDGTGDGTVTDIDDETLTFIDFYNLTGSSESDTFNFSAGASVAGSIDGEGGTNTVVAADVANAWNLTSNSAGSLNSTDFLGIENLTGAATEVDTFTFRFDGTFSGTVDARGGDDIVDISDTTSGNATITIGSAVNGVTNAEIIRGNNSGTLTVNRAASTATQVDWTIGEISGLTGDDGSNDGYAIDQNLNKIIFLDFANLRGSSSADKFTVETGSAITGTITGGGGLDELVVTNNSTTTTSDSVAWRLTGDRDGSVNFTTGSTTESVLDFVNITKLTGMGSLNHTLTGENQTNDWQVTGLNSGTVSLQGSNADEVTFGGMQSITGGTGVDVFTVGESGIITGVVSGGDNAATSDKIIGRVGVDNLWGITGAYAGSVTEDRTTDEVYIASFTDIQELAGSTGDDTFKFSTGSEMDSVNAGSMGIDTADFSGKTESVLVEISGSSVSGFSGFTRFIGNNDGVLSTTYESSLAVTSGVNNWEVTDFDDSATTADGVNDGTVGGIQFVNFNVLEGGSGNDSFDFSDGTGSITGQVIGNGGTNKIVGYTAASKFDLGPSGVNSGSVSLVSGTTYVSSFDGIQAFTGGAGNDVLNASSLNADITVDLDSTSTSGTHQLSSIEVINANGSDGRANTLLADDRSGGNVWDITTALSGTINTDEITFSGFQKLTAGNSGDTFNIDASINTITGGSGNDVFDIGVAGLAFNIVNAIAADSDTLKLDYSATNTWTINGGTEEVVDTGTTNIQFSDIETINAGSGRDIFNVTAVFGGRINAGAGDDSFDLDADVIDGVYGDAGTDIFDIGATIAGAVNGGTGSDTFTISSASADATIAAGDDDTDILQLAHTSAENTWTINAGQNGLVATVSGGEIEFTSIETILGGNTATAEDTFNVNASYVGSIEGRGGNDTFNLNATVTGNLLGGNEDDSFILSHAVTGSVQGNSGADVFNIGATVRDGISGGTGTDIFNLTTTNLSVGLAGGDNSDTFNYSVSGVDAVWEMDAISNRVTNGTGSVTFSSMDTVNSGAGNDDFIVSTAYTGNLNAGAGNDEFDIDATLTGNISGGSGVDTFRLSSNVSGSVLGEAGNDEFIVDGASRSFGTLSGGGNTDSLTIDTSADAAITWVIGTGGHSFDYGASSGANSFSSIETLVSDGGSDVFNVTTAFTGSIEGSAGADTFNLGANVSGGVSGSAGADTFNLNNQNLAGFTLSGGTDSDNDLLRVSHGATSNWIIGTTSSVASSGTLTFSGMDTLEGSSGIDSFDINVAFAGAINGNGNDDTFNIGAQVGDGSTIGIDGGAGNDTFIAEIAGFGLLLDGGDNTDTLSLNQGEAATWLIDGTNTVTNGSASVNFSGIETLNGSSAIDDFTVSTNFTGTLNGRGGADIFDISTGVTLIGDISGGAGNDSFTISGNVAAGGSATGAIDGGDNNDTFSLTGSVAGNVSGSGGNDTFTLRNAAIGYTILGGGMEDILNGYDAVSNWDLTGTPYSITATATTNFSEIEKLVGSDSAADTFTFASLSSALGISSVTAGTGDGDVVDYSSVAATGNVTAGNSDYSGVSGAEIIVGSSSLTLVSGSTAGDDVEWKVYDFDGTGSLADGKNDGEIGSLYFANFGNLQGGSGNDHFLFDGGYITGMVSGGAAEDTSDNDTISRTTLAIGTLEETVTEWSVTSAGAGTVTSGITDSPRIANFQRIENLTGNNGSDSFVFNDAASVAGIIVGGLGTDSITTEHTTAYTWDLTQEGGGSVGFIYEGNANGFSGIERLSTTGGSQTYELNGGWVSSITGSESYTDIVRVTDTTQDTHWNILTGDVPAAEEAGSNNGGIVSWTTSDATDVSLSFDNIDTFYGGDGVDTAVVAGVHLRGGIWGGESTNADGDEVLDSIDLSAIEGGTRYQVDIYGNKSAVTGSGSGETIVVIDEEFELRDVDGYDELIALDNYYTGDQETLWRITGVNTVELRGSVFTDVGIIYGTTETDTFAFVGDGSLAGEIHGSSSGSGTGTDKIVAADIDTTWDIGGVSLFDSPADGYGAMTYGTNRTTFEGIEVIDAGEKVDTFNIQGQISTLNANGGDDTFNVLEELSSSFAGTLSGGSGNDTFNLEQSVTQAVNGGVGNDTFNILAATVNATLIGSGNDVQDKLLLQHSIDSVWTVNGGGSESVTNSSGGSVTFSGMESLTGGGGEDTFTLSVNVPNVSGGGNNDTFTITNGSLVLDIDGGSGDADHIFLQVSDNNTWDIASATEGNVGVSDNIEFSNMDILEGGSGEDTFNVDTAFIGELRGGSGADSFYIDATGNTLVVVGGDDTATDTLYIDHTAATTWTIDGEDGSEVATDASGTVEFSEIEIANASSGIDTVTVSAVYAGRLNGRGSADIFNIGDQVSGGVYGGDGNDTFKLTASGITSDIFGEGGEDDSLSIEHDRAENIWQVTAVDGGSVDGLDYATIENLKGGSGVDRFNITASVVGAILGRDGNDEFNVNTAGLDLEVQGGDGSNTLSLNYTAASSWELDGDRELISATDSEIGFESFDVLNGSQGGDTFTLTTVDYNGVINGRGGEDTFNLSTNVTGGVNGGDANDIFTFFVAGLTTAVDGEEGAGDTLVAANAENSWLIDGTNAGTVTNSAAVSFSNIENITGGTGEDTFSFASAGSGVDGLIDGSSQPDGGKDTLNAKALGGGLVFTMGSDAPAGISFDRIEAITVTEADVGDTGNYNTISSGDGSNDWTIDGRNTGELTESGATTRFTGFQIIQGGDGEDGFLVLASGSDDVGIDGGIDGGGQPEGGFDTIDYSNYEQDLTVTIGSSTSGITGVEGFTGYREDSVGSAYKRTLIGRDANSTWVLRDTGDSTDGVNDGAYTQGEETYGFNNFDTLVGGNKNDNFIFEGVATVTGGIEGGEGTNTISTTGTTVAQRIQVGGDVDGNTNITNISEIVDTSSSDLMHTLVASAGQDNTFTLNGEGQGNLNGDLMFANVANLIGGDKNDTFVLTGAGDVRGVMNGGAGTLDRVDLQNMINSGELVVEVGSNVTANLNIDNIEQLEFREAAETTLLADDVANDWRVDRTNGGSLSYASGSGGQTLEFIHVDNISGGAADDYIQLANTGSISGVIRGGDASDANSDSDSLILTGIDRAIHLSLSGSDAADVRATGFESVEANAAFENELAAGNSDNSWIISGSNSGEIEAMDFTGFASLVGGTANDSFVFEQGGSISGTLDGGAHTSADSVDMSRVIGSITVNLGEGENAVRNIEVLTGNNEASLIAANQANRWDISSGENSGIINDAITFTDFNNLIGGNARDIFNVNGGSVTGSINGGEDNDIVNVSISNGLTGSINVVGGEGENDILSLDGDVANMNVAYSPAVDGGGRLEYSDGVNTSYVVDFVTTETVTDRVQANTMTFNGSTAAETIAFSSGQVQVGDYKAVAFTDKDNLIIAGASDDTILMSGAINVPGQLTLTNATVTVSNTDTRVLAQSVVLDGTRAVGSVALPVALDVANLSVSAAGGDVYLSNRRGLTLTQLTTVNDFTLEAQGNVVATNALNSQGAVNIIANNGDIQLSSSSNVLDGALSLVAVGREVSVKNSRSTQLAEVRAQTLEVNSVGAISDRGAAGDVIQVTGVSTLQSSGDITLDTATNDFDTVTITNGVNVVLVDQNSFTLGGFQANGNLSTQSNGLLVSGTVQTNQLDIQAGTGRADINNTVTVTNEATLSGNAIVINDSLSASAISMAAGTGGVSVSGSAQTNGGTISLVSASDISQAGSLVSNGGEIQLTADGSINMLNSGGTNSSGANIVLSAQNSIALAQVSAGEATLTLVAGGSIEDVSSGTYGLIANRLEVAAGNGVTGQAGTGMLETDVAELSVTNQSNTVAIDNAGAVEIQALRSNGDVTLQNQAGDIVFNNTEDNTFNGTETDAVLAGGLTSAGYNAHDIQVVAVNGNILATGDMNYNQPDLVGHNIHLTVENKEMAIGSQARALVIHASGDVPYFTFNGVNPAWAFGAAGPGGQYLPEGNLPDLFDASILAGQQLVEVDEVEEIDPAIFSAVTNYFFDDVSIRLPNDQLYDDELEELAASN
ncbi:filamentous hemagglutinin N-terminal domain-containing protein [Teredinibacter haidensis]|uniref:filamentous hemagglutinin N-terminal domain-containing protein n=1 Tax=Teredinibacter haidensis TaxID=2731755 RepID=UPI0009FA60C8|nr:filamentous hemagglutinin N-terminal domain-containing protein [Teredinibacter haidensis]